MFNLQDYTLKSLSIDFSRGFTHFVLWHRDKDGNTIMEVPYVTSHIPEVDEFVTTEVPEDYIDEEIVTNPDGTKSVGKVVKQRNVPITTPTGRKIPNDNYLSPFATEAEILAWVAKKPEFNS